MGFLGVAYRRPAQKPAGGAIQQLERDQEASSDQSLQSMKSVALAGVPDALTFDRIMDGDTCPPCTVRDFMNYLRYMEHLAENLQFFLWYRSFSERFHSAEAADLILAPEWTPDTQEEIFAKLQRDQRGGLKRDPAHAAAVFQRSDFEKRDKALRLSESTASVRMDRPSPIFSEFGSNPFSTPPRSPLDGIHQSTIGESNALRYRCQAAEAFASAGTRAPFTMQPFREEIDRIIATYIMDGAPRQLRLSERERKQVLIALSHTTHPTAFRQVAWAIESTLRMQAHPNFIRWSIRNGNRQRVVFANLVGAFLIAGSLAAYLLLWLSSVPRGFCAIPAVGLVLGVTTQYAALQGMCVVLHGMHHRQMRPWELLVDGEMELRDEKGGGGAEESCEGVGSTNSYEDEPWVMKYPKRSLARKVFDREVWIQEPALRGVQDTIFVQALLVAFVSAAALTAVFVSVPGGGFY